MLREYAITPDAVDPHSYSSAEHFETVVGELGREMRRGGLVRNLRAGEWIHVLERTAARSPITRELIELITKRKRLVHEVAYRPTCPADDLGWTEEALQAHEMRPLSGIITTAHTARAHEAEQIVAAVTRLHRASWWNRRDDSITITRDRESYIKTFRPIFRHARGVVFVDPYLDTTKHHYAQSVPELLKYISRINAGCSVEVVTQSRNSDETRALRADLASICRSLGIKLTLFVVTPFFFKRYRHERYLVSDLATLSLTNGFDTDDEIMTVCILNEQANEHLQRALDQARQETACQRFEIADNVR